MKIRLTIEAKNGARHGIEFESHDSDSVCYAMGRLEQNLETGYKLIKIDYD